MIDADDCHESDREGYEADWENYEPDAEEIAWELAKERRFEEWLSYIHESERELRDYHKYTDSQLRELSAEAKSLSRELRDEYRFDVVHDCYELGLDGETSITVSRSGVCLDEVPCPLTRKDKRRRKTECRRASRLLRPLEFLTKRGCSPRQVRGYEDRSFDTVVAAV
jgi:hypothetical protein